VASSHPAQASAQAAASSQNVPFGLWFCQFTRFVRPGTECAPSPSILDGCQMELVNKPMVGRGLEGGQPLRRDWVTDTKHRVLGLRRQNMTAFSKN